MLGKNYEATNNFIAAFVRNRGNSLFQRNLSKYPLQVVYGDQGSSYKLEKLEMNVSLPWTRIFEISIDTKLSFTKIL